jgi:RNA polymerase sigma-70 factor, ECF subfamily
MSSARDRMATPPREITESFDEVVLPHLDAAYRLARWLMRNEHDAEDAVQEASLRALRYFRTFSGGNARAWFLRIVRNTCCGWQVAGFIALSDPFDEEQHSSVHPASNPETLLLQTADVTLIKRTMRIVPDRFRELLVLREIEGLSYKEIAEVTGIPMGTVMSRLSRARQAFRGALIRDRALECRLTQRSEDHKPCVIPGDSVT